MTTQIKSVVSQAVAQDVRRALYSGLMVSGGTIAAYCLEWLLRSIE